MAFVGDWKVMYTSKVMGIHAAMLNDGKILLFSYPSREKQHQEVDNDHGHHHSIFGSASHSGAYEMINPEKWIGEPGKLEKNIFCGGHCFLNNGNLFVSGGQYQAIHNPALLFDPPSMCNYIFNMKGWTLQKRTLTARWYPTCLTLDDGRALVSA
jgi:hypothetical protein